MAPGTIARATEFGKLLHTKFPNTSWKVPAHVTHMAETSWEEWCRRYLANSPANTTPYGHVIPLEEVVHTLLHLPDKQCFPHPTTAPTCPSTDVLDGPVTAHRWTDGGWKLTPAISLREAVQSGTFIGDSEGRTTALAGWEGFFKDWIAPAWFRPHVKVEQLTPDFTSELTHLGQQGVIQYLANAFVEKLGPPQVVVPLFHAYSGTSPTGRPIWDCRYVNLCEEGHVPAYTLPQPRDIGRVVQEGDYMAIADFKSGYYHVGLRPTIRRMFGVVHPVDNSLHVTCALPLGLSSAPYGFWTVTRGPLRWVIDNVTGRVFLYIDDLTVIGVNLTEWARIRSIFRQCGFQWSVKKSMPTPATTIVALGIAFDSVSMTMSCSPKRAQKLKDKTATLRIRMSWKDVASIIGSIVSLGVLDQFLLWRLQPAIDLLRTKPVGHSWTRLTTVSLEVQHALTTVSSFVRTHTAPLGVHPPNHTVYTDACETGWGAVVCSTDSDNVRLCRGNWDYLGAHSTTFELAGVAEALTKNVDLLSNSNVAFVGDNSGVVAILNKCATSKAVLRPLLDNIITTCIEHHIVITKSVHIPGEHNVLPDELSRLPYDTRSDWCLQEFYLEKFSRFIAARNLPIPEIDGFASLHNARYKQFCSAFFEVGSLGDFWAVCHTLRGRPLWLNPPFLWCHEVLATVLKLGLTAWVLLPHRRRAPWWYLTASAREVFTITPMKGYPVFCTLRDGGWMETPTFGCSIYLFAP